MWLLVILVFGMEIVEEYATYELCVSRLEMNVAAGFSAVCAPVDGS